MITRTALATMGTTRSLPWHGLLVDVRARCKSLPHEDVRGLDDLAVAVLGEAAHEAEMSASCTWPQLLAAYAHRPRHGHALLHLLLRHLQRSRLGQISMMACPQN